MRIIHFTTTLDFAGGIETYLLNLMPELEQRNHGQIVAFAGGNPSLWPNAVHFPEMNEQGKRAERGASAKFKKLIRESRPDVVHLHNVTNWGLVRSSLECIPTVMTTHGYRYICPSSDLYYKRTREICELSCSPRCFSTTVKKHCMSVRPPYLWSYYRFARKIMEHANDFKRIIAPSQYAKDRYVRAGFASEQIEVLPYFCPVAPISESKDFDAKQITLLFIGRIRPYKGVDYFIDALAQLPEYVRGVIIGDIETSYAKELAESESARSCGGRLRFRKWMERNELATVMREATALIFPSIWPETMGIVGPEAMAHGVPVVSCKVGGIEEWLQDGINGYLAPPKDATAIALAVKRLVSSPENYRCFSESGKQLMREKFSVNRHVDRLVRIYKEAIEP